MEIVYEEMSAATPSETILLNAIVLPMLIMDRRTVMTNDTIKLLRGIGLPTTMATCQVI